MSQWILFGLLGRGGVNKGHIMYSPAGWGGGAFLCTRLGRDGSQLLVWKFCIWGIQKKRKVNQSIVKKNKQVMHSHVMMWFRCEPSDIRSYWDFPVSAVCSKGETNLILLAVVGQLVSKIWSFMLENLQPLTWKWIPPLPLSCTKKYT